MQRHLKLTTVAFITILTVFTALAQAPGGTLRVVVKNASGNTVAGVEIHATHRDSSLSAIGWTDGEGTYTFTGMPSGEYEVRVASPGLPTQLQFATIEPSSEMMLRVQLPSAEVEEERQSGSSFRRQVVVIDIPGIETDGRNRPDQWGPILTGSNDFARHNIRHEGRLGFHLQRPEPGVTTTLPHVWNAQRDTSAFAPALQDVQAGRNLYVKFDQNMKLPSYVFGGKPSEGQWVKSSVDSFVSQVKKINPAAEIVVNTHSKGTLDALRLNLSPVGRVNFASPRFSPFDIQQLAVRYPDTKFTLITGDRDFPHGLQGFMKVNAPNVTMMNLKNGGLGPFTVHGQVTDPSFRGVFDIKTLNGIQRTTSTLGDLFRPPSMAAGGDKPLLPVGPSSIRSTPPGRVKFGNLDPGGILIPTTNEYETDTTGITQGLRSITRKPD